MSKVVSYDKTGTPKGEILCIPDRSYLLGEAGDAIFSLDTTYARKIADLLTPGSLITVQGENLPDWGGVIDLPQEWFDGVSTFHAYSAEKMLTDAWRQGDGKQISGTSGQIISKVVDLANAPEDLLLRCGFIDINDESRVETIGDGIGLLDEINRMASKYGFQWTIKPAINSLGGLSFKLYWYRIEKGLKMRQDYIISLDNMKPNSQAGMTVQGTISNQITATSMTSGGSISFPHSSTYTDLTSTGLYRVRTKRLMLDQDQTPNAILAAAQQYAFDNSIPRVTFGVSVLDKNGLFTNLELGDIAHYINPQIGFRGIDTWARITGMAYIEASRETQLTLDEVRNA